MGSINTDIDQLDQIAHGGAVKFDIRENEPTGSAYYTVSDSLSLAFHEKVPARLITVWKIQS